MTKLGVEMTRTMEEAEHNADVNPKAYGPYAANPHGSPENVLGAFIVATETGELGSVPALFYPHPAVQKKEVARFKDSMKDLDHIRAAAELASWFRWLQTTGRLKLEASEFGSGPRLGDAVKRVMVHLPSRSRDLLNDPQQSSNSMTCASKSHRNARRWSCRLFAATGSGTL